LSLVQAYYFTPTLLGPEESWRLLRWCVEQGASEFSLRVLSVASESGPIADEFEDAFAACFISTARRRVMTSVTGDRTRDVRLWRLDSTSAALLESYLPRGLFTNAVNPLGWFEDPLVYRNGELMLGVVTHEQEGVLRVSSDELRELERLGFDFELAGNSIEY
jgi:hypothetical protein